MKLALALLLTLPVAAQSIPPTWPDRVDAKPQEPNFRKVYIGNCVSMDGVEPHAPKTYWYACPPSERPPAKHHSMAPQGHKSHTRRKVRK